MKTVFFPDIHRRLPKSFAKSLEAHGFKILLPDNSFIPHIKYWKKWSKEELKNDYMKDVQNVDIISYDELTKKTIDIFFITCYEVQDDMLKIYNNYGKNSKLVHYAGNNFVPYDYNKIKNLITTDEIIFQKARINKKNALMFFPWVDFDNDYRFEETNNSKNINSYILNYKSFFPQQYQQAIEIKDIFKTKEYNVNFIENELETSIPQIMNNSFLTLHIKPIEGYGFSILESMAKGRPVILYKPYSENKIYRHWALDMQTCIYFDNNEELLKKFSIYEKNYQEIQFNCASKIRKLINLDKHSKNLASFLNNLV